MLLIRIKIIRALNCIASLLKSTAIALTAPTHRLMARVTVSTPTCAALIMLVLVAGADHHGRLLVGSATVLKINHMVLLLLILILVLICVFFSSSFIDGLLLIVAAVVQLSGRVHVGARDSHGRLVKRFVGTIVKIL